MPPTVRQRLTSLVTRRYPFLSGCGTLANSRFARRLAGEAGGVVWGRLRDGQEVRVPLDDYVGRAVFYAGDLDRKLSAVIRRLVDPGVTVVDVGANLGVVTLQLARLVGPAGSVHSFEPNPVVRTLLAESVAANGHRNVRIHPVALGPADDVLELTVPTGNAGRATLTRGGVEGATVRVSVRPLAAVMAENGVRRVRLLKIDVEGFELEVLRGAAEWFATSPPDVVLFESNGCVSGRAGDPVFALLRAVGYRLYSIPKRLLAIALVPCPEGGTAVTHDMLAVHRDCEADVAVRFGLRLKPASCT